MGNKILILTALSLEFDAVKDYLIDIKPVAHPETGSIYNQGAYTAGNKVYDVLLVETGAGNVRAADETGRAISYFKPDYTLFVGISGGVKDVKLGDVVASTKVIGYEMGKDEQAFKPRFDTAASSYILEQLAKHVKRENKWIVATKAINGKLPEVFVQPIAAGEKVVASNRSVAFSYLRQFCSDAIAVDMEGIGFLMAARPYHTHAIEIRGISDLIENKDEADAAGSQPAAAANAATFAFAMINALTIMQPMEQKADTLAFRKSLVDELVKLYPQGPEQEDIWKRAGGDVSILVNAASRRSQWFNAIDKLALGGGGKGITLATLINEVNLDYPDAVTGLF